jgi:hypothetical protein
MEWATFQTKPSEPCSHIFHKTLNTQTFFIYQNNKSIL